MPLTLDYIAPDMIKSDYTVQIDVFMLGIVAVNILFNILFYNELANENLSSDKSFLHFFTTYFGDDPESKQADINELLRLFFKSHSYEDTKDIHQYQWRIKKNKQLAYSSDSNISGDAHESKVLTDKDKIFMILSMLQVILNIRISA